MIRYQTTLTLHLTTLTDNTYVETFVHHLKTGVVPGVLKSGAGATISANLIVTAEIGIDVPTISARMLASLLKNLLPRRGQKRNIPPGAAATGLIRLHIGGQIAHPDWKIFDLQAGPHVDYVGHCADLSRFADASILEVYASHVIEHLGFRTELPTALHEFNRVLIPGGTLRVSVPDLDTLCELFLDPEMSMIQRFHVMQMMFGSQINPSDIHYVGLNEEILLAFLQETGFIDIVRVDKFGLFEDASNMVYKKPISLNMAARKPLTA